MGIRRIDHTAIAVRDLDEALSRYDALFGATVEDRRRVPDQQVAVAFLKLGDSQIELIQPLDAHSGVARFLERHGEGLHHIAVEVDDVEEELIRFMSDGIELIDSSPRQGAHGRIAFVHPRGTGGVLLELVELPR